MKKAIKRKIVQFIIGLILSAVAAKLSSMILGDDITDNEPKEADF